MDALQLNRRNLMRLGAISAGSAGLAGIGANATHSPFGPIAAHADGGAVKTRATYYTPERVEAARTNIEEIGWAQQMRDEAVAAADKYLGHDLENLWHAVTTQGLPRSYAVNQALGSPITGTDIFEYGNYPWIGDIHGAPWKLKDPSSDYVFPTNDFASFYLSALDENGNFNRDLGDPQYLVNTAYPEMGETWGVDDGYGWVDDDGERWTFVAYYNHWFVWYTPSAPVGVEPMQSIWGGVRSLRDAYLYTGDVKYATYGITLLDRMADVYPDMDISVYAKADGYLNSDGGRSVGKAIGCIWETSVARDLTLSYDAFFPALTDGDPAGVVPLLSQQADTYGLGSKASTADIRANIENGVVRQVFPAVQKSQIFGNFGMHQSALATAAVVLDEESSTSEWLDFVFAAGDLVRDSEGDYITGGNVGPTLVNQVDRDGWYAEVAPQYNVLPVGQLTMMARALDGYDLYPSADLYEHPKYASMIKARPGLTMLNRYTPSIGDSNQTGKPYIVANASDYVTAFERYGWKEDAQAAYLKNENSTEDLRGDIFAVADGSVADRVQEVLDEHGPLDLKSVNLTGYGLAIHRRGTAPAGHAMTTFYGSNLMHGQWNTLTLGCFAYGLDLMPGLGYPEFADSNARRLEWESNTVAGNTVVVDRTRHADTRIGRTHGYLSTDEVHYTDVDAPGVYPDLAMYRRTSVQVAVDDDHGYIVDLFRIRGGEEHVFSFHTAEGSATVTGAEMTPQDGGSYAGPDIIHPDPKATPRPGADGFDWLINVERGTPEGQFTVEWDIVDTYGVTDGSDIKMRLSMLNDVNELALADGIPPRNKTGNPQSLRYLLARRDAERSCFASVIEPFRDAPAVKEQRYLTVTSEGQDLGDDAVAIEVKLADGRTDWVVHDTVGGRELLVEGRFRVTARMAVIRFAADGSLASVTGDDIVEIRDNKRKLLREHTVAGTVASRTDDLADISEMVIDLVHPIQDRVDLTGRYVYLEGENNPVYRIASAQPDGRKVTLTVDTTFVRAFADDEDLDAGYVYDVEPGMAARIPLSNTWRA